jgi:hypothetical protein
MVSSGMLRRVAPARTDVSEEPSASIIRVTRIGVLGTTLAATSKGCLTIVTMKNVVFWDIKHSSYFTEDTLRLSYRVQPVNAM